MVDVLLGQFPPDGVLRLHAYDSARRLHREVAAQAGRPGAVDRAVDTLLEEVRLLFLNELHAHDPGDAMLLSRLLRALPERGATLMATSNYPPRGLLPNPLHHHLVLPLVDALEAGCDVLELAGPVDHRRAGHGGARPGWSAGAWAAPGSEAQAASLGLVVPVPGEGARLTVGGRPLTGPDPERGASLGDVRRPVRRADVGGRHAGDRRQVEDCRDVGGAAAR